MVINNDSSSSPDWTGSYLVGYVRGKEDEAIDYIESQDDIELEESIVYRTLVVNGDDESIEELIDNDLFDHVERESIGSVQFDG